MDMSAYLTAPLQLDKICRACLTEKSNMKPLYSAFLSETLNSFASIQAQQDDGLPNQICGQCVLRCIDAHAFKQLCEKSDRILREFISPEFQAQLQNPVTLTYTSDFNTDMSAYLAAPLQLDKICRACLTEKSNMKPLYSAFLNETLNSFVFVQAQQDDGLPSLLCAQCVLQCIDAYAFKQLCEKSDRILCEFTKPELQAQSQESVMPVNIKMEIDQSFELDQLVQDKDAIKSEPDPKLDRNTIKEADNGNNKQLAEIEALPVANPPPALTETKLKTDLKDGPYVCTVCNMAFAYKIKLKMHANIHLDKKPFKCDQCDKTFSHKHSLYKHLNIHFAEKQYKCDQCDNSYADSTVLKKHKREHINAKPYLCSECGRAFKSITSLKNHINDHTNQILISCKYCNKHYLRAESLKNHLRSHKGERPHSCDVCQKSFWQRYRLKEHYRGHTGEKPYACSVCDKTFAQLGTLTSHMRTHTGEKPYACETCAKAFTTSGSLKAHRRMHTGEKPYKCETCDVRFARLQTLIVHRRSHTGERPFGCKTCGRKFITSSVLAIHQRSHTGERPFECKTCGKGFTSSTTLYSHAKIHTSVRSHICDVCGKGFIRSDYLAGHKKTHTTHTTHKKLPMHSMRKEKNHVCNTCGVKFTNRDRLKYHMKCRHFETDSESENDIETDLGVDKSKNFEDKFD